MGYEKAGRLGARRLRRGGRPILESARSFAQLLKAGQWHSPAYCLSSDFGADEAAAMERALFNASEDEAEPGGPRGGRVS